MSIQSRGGALRPLAKINALLFMSASIFVNFVIRFSQYRYQSVCVRVCVCVCVLVCGVNACKCAHLRLAGRS